MKRIIAGLMIVLPLAVTSVPQEASALEININSPVQRRVQRPVRPVVRVKERQLDQRRWVPGYWERTRNQRRWVPGHYEYRR
jgi:hypothetical protein